MARVVVLGAGISGHAVALHLRRKLGRAHEVVVVSPRPDWNWIPSNIWVGVGRMPTSKVSVPLAPVYRRKGITLHQAKAVQLWPEGGGGHTEPSVVIEYTDPDRRGRIDRLTYDYLVNATGPKLDFAATPGLGPGAGNSVSVCSAPHAEHAWQALRAVIAELEAGRRQTLVIGAGHGASTCQGAAFEYVFNVEHELRARGLRDLADIVYLTNEHDLGDFGVGGLVFDQQGYVSTSQLWAESLFRERGVRAIVRAHVERVEPGKVHFETLDGGRHSLRFDFAMLLPPFRGQDLTAHDATGADITADLFAPNGFMKVDADYTPKPYEQWRVEDWPRTYQTRYPNVFAIGIAFAPPHAISRPRTSANGTPISPTPPRTGMPSMVMGRAVAFSVADMIDKNATRPTHTASLAQMGAACVASSGTGMLAGSAVSMTMFPVVPDHGRYPGAGRSLTHTTGDIGLAGHWMKYLTHHVFLYKAKARPGWSWLPE